MTPKAVPHNSSSAMVGPGPCDVMTALDAQSCPVGLLKRDRGPGPCDAHPGVSCRRNTLRPPADAKGCPRFTPRRELQGHLCDVAFLPIWPVDPTWATHDNKNRQRLKATLMAARVKHQSETPRPLPHPKTAMPPARDAAYLSSPHILVIPTALHLHLSLPCLLLGY